MVVTASVDEDEARAAKLGSAPEARALEAEVVAQHVDEQRAIVGGK